MDTYSMGDVTMGPVETSWQSEDNFNMFETVNRTRMMEGDHYFHSVYQKGQPFEIGNNTFYSASEEPSNLRHSLFWTIVLIFAYVGVFVVGFVGNAMVICVLTMKRQMKSVTNLFILNLAIADMSVIIFCTLPTLLANIFVPWLLGSFMCKAVAYVQGVSVCASVYSLVAISVDRFLVIMFPTKMPRGLTTSHARVIIICIWALSLMIFFPWLIAFRLIPSGQENVEYCVESWPESMDSRLFFLIGNLFFCYGLPLILILISNGLIWRHVAQREVPPESASPAAIKSVHRKTRQGVFKMLSIVSLTFLISWLPLYLIFLRIKLGGPLNETTENFISITLPFAQWMGVSNSSCNPILYAFLNQTFRDSFKSLIACPRFVRSRQNTLTLTTTCYSNHMSLNPKQRFTSWQSRRLNTLHYPISQV